MANMPVSIPLDLKIKGLKALAAHQGAVAADVARLLDGQMILAEAVGSLLAEVRELVTNVERLNTALDNIQTDITGLKDAAVAAQNDFAVRLDALQAALDAANADNTAETQAAVDAAVQELTDANNAALADLVAKADAIDLQTPAAEVPEDPTPPVDENPPVEPEPNPPVEENPPVEGNPDPEQPVEPV